LNRKVGRLVHKNDFLQTHQDNLATSLSLTKKKAPEYSFQNNSKRVFAEFKHKTLVPSPDTYFKEERAMTKKGELQGAAFCATNNSIHTFYGVRTIHKSPPRFDNIKDKYDSKKPAPTSYNPKDYHRKKALAHVRAKAARFSKKDYFTFSPGPGTYSHQSEFCDRPSETFDALSQSSLTKNSSTKDKPRKDQ